MTRTPPPLAALLLLVVQAASSADGRPGAQSQPGSLHETQRPHSNQAEPTPPVRGADVGWLSEMEAAGKTFRDRQGRTRDGLAILKDMGVEAIRLRVWVNPADGWCGPADVVRQAARARRMGFRLMIDFHYSDSWADPGQQTKPAAWAGHDLEQLKTDVRDHTTSVLRALRDSGVAPEWVQVGNETNDGMLWPEGKASTNMAGYAALVTAGSRAVKQVFPDAKVVVHVSNGWDNGLFRWNFDGLKTHKAEYDVIAMSLYPEPATWRTMAGQTRDNMRDMVSRHGKDVMVSEVGMDWMAADSTRALLVQVQEDLRAIGPRGRGVFYWEPLSHYGWKGYFKGAFDDQGQATVALTAFQSGPVGVRDRHRPAALTRTVELRDPLGRSFDAPKGLAPGYRGTLSP